MTHDGHTIPAIEHRRGNPAELGSKIAIAGFSVAAAGFLCVVAAGPADAQASAPPAAQEIVRAGSQPPQQGPAEYFTGRVRVDPVWPANATSTLRAAWSPSSRRRSAWHTHPRGQRLVVISELG